jgi:hypothetical protein
VSAASTVGDVFASASVWMLSPMGQMRTQSGTGLGRNAAELERAATELRQFAKHLIRFEGREIEQICDLLFCGFIY